MELRHLHYFIAVAEQLNFTRAGKKLRVAQPAFTRQVHNLDEELGIRLFDRAKIQVSLKKEGASFLVDAKNLIAASLESVKAVQCLRRGNPGQLNLGYLARFNFDLCPRPCKRSTRATPK